MMRMLQSSWMAMVIGGLTFLGVTAALLRPAVARLHARDDGTHASKGAQGPSWDFFNPELDRLIAELKKEKQTLAARGQQLNELAMRLQAEREEINKVTQTVTRLQQEFDRNVLRIRDEETANLKKLAKIYAIMSPEGAAQILRQLGDEEIAKFLTFMKEGEAAPILEGFAKLGGAEAKRAATISDRLRKAVRPGPSDKQ